MNSVGAVIVASGYGGHGKKQNPMEEIDECRGTDCGDISACRNQRYSGCL